MSGTAKHCLRRQRSANWKASSPSAATVLYVQKRSSDWLKIKIVRRQECVIGGYTDPRGSRENFGSVVLGLYDDQGRLIPVGQAGSGFTGNPTPPCGSDCTRWRRSAIRSSARWKARPRALREAGASCRNQVHGVDARGTERRSQDARSRVSGIALRQEAGGVQVRACS